MPKIEIKHQKIFVGKKEVPLIWLFIDEAHEFLVKEGKTAASDALIQILREGRQPGISLVMATQQPGYRRDMDDYEPGLGSRFSLEQDACSS